MLQQLFPSWSFTLEIKYSQHFTKMCPSKKHQASLSDTKLAHQSNKLQMLLFSLNNPSWEKMVVLKPLAFCIKQIKMIQDHQIITVLWKISQKICSFVFLFRICTPPCPFPSHLTYSRPSSNPVRINLTFPTLTLWYSNKTESLR